MTHKPPLFSLGQVVATPGALQALEANQQDPWDYLRRHRQGDWGDVCQEDSRLNSRAVVEGTRILSAYNLPDGTRSWVLTEADRSATTVLLPEEY